MPSSANGSATPKVALPPGWNVTAGHWPPLATNSVDHDGAPASDASVVDAWAVVEPEATAPTMDRPNIGSMRTRAFMVAST